jgi:hypothetical protein
MESSGSSMTAAMEPIHRAALDGDVAAIDRLVAEDGERLNARNQVDPGIRGLGQCEDCTPLMLAAYQRHDAVVARLLALGADVGLQSFNGSSAAHMRATASSPLLWLCCSTPALRWMRATSSDRLR